MTAPEIIQKLSEQIQACDSRSIPTVCKKIATPNGLTYVQNRVIHFVTKDNMEIESALAQVESELNEIA